MRDVAPILRSLGLLESEVKVYLAALERGPSTVIDLAGATRLSRPATYTAIESLTERGLTSTVQRGKKRLFAAEHPDHLVQYAHRREVELRSKIEDLTRLVPELALRAGGGRPVVKVLEGAEGILAFIDDVQRTRPTTMEEITNIDAMRLVVRSEDLAPMRDELLRIGTKIRGLYAGTNVRANATTDARLLPPALSSFRGDITIYGDKAAIVTFAGKLHTVLIEDSVVAETLRTLFELAWARGAAFPVVPKT